MSIISETELQIRLRRAKDAFERAKEEERDARIALARAEKSLAAAKENYYQIFADEERAEIARRGESYRDCTL